MINRPADSLDNANLVEQVLGVPLTPEGVPDAPIEDTIRDFAHAATVRAVKRRTQWTPGEDLFIEREADLMALREDPQLQRIAAQLRAANDTLQYWHNPPPMPVGADVPETARGQFQSRALAAIVEHAQRAPGVTNPSAESPFSGGLLTMAPPGAGKTVLQALALHHAGVGLPISEVNPQRRTAVGILNSKILIEQGLDPSETLQRFSNLGDRELRVGAYYTKRRDGHDEYDLLLTTPRSYEIAVESGAINPQTTVRYVLDEAHRVAMAPSMSEHVASFDSGLYMFTATPAIAGGRRDLRKMFPHSQFGSMREFIEDGILSPVQLFTYKAGPEKGSEARLAISLAADYVRSGRKTLVVCQPGNKLEQARQIATELNHLHDTGQIVPHERFNWDGGTLAAAIGTYPGADVPGDLKLLREGKRLIATTVATGNEGMNIPDLDALVIIGPQGATWVVEQWLGRVLRPSGQIAIASEILPAGLQPGKPIASIFGPFGMHNEVITAGYYIGPKLQEFRDAVPANIKLSAPGYALAHPQAEHEAEAEVNAEETDAMSPAGIRPPLSDNVSPGALYEPPADVQESLVAGISVREATIAPADLLKIPPDDYGTLEGIAPDGVPVEWLYAMMDKLDDPDIRYIGVWEPDETGQTRYVRYYSPAAHAYFAEHPIPELVSENEFLDEEIARMLGVSRKQVRAILDANGIQPLERITKYHRNPNYYGMDTLAFVAAEVAKTPLADETDVAVVDLGKEISDDFIKHYMSKPDSDITPVYKRRHPTWGVVGTVQHITAEEADRLRSMYTQLEVADPDKYIGFTQMAKQAGVSLSGLLNKLNALDEEQLPQMRLLRSAPKRRPAFFVDREWGDAFVEYVRPEKILPWEVTLHMVATYFGKKKMNMTQILNKRGLNNVAARVPLPGVSETILYPISILMDLQEDGLEPAEGMPAIRSTRLALNEDEAHNPARAAASRELQRYFIPPEQLAAPGEVGYYARRRHTPPTLPSPVREATLQELIEDHAVEIQAVKKTEVSPAVSLGLEPVAEKPEPQPVAGGAVSMEDAQNNLGCDAYAFWYLLERVPFTTDEVTTNEDNEITGFLEGGMQKLAQASMEISMPPREWSTLGMTAYAAGRTDKDTVLAALAEYEQHEGRQVNENEARLCRNGAEVDLYFSPTLKREIRRLIIS